jgi:hypothetical protein
MAVDVATGEFVGGGVAVDAAVGVGGVAGTVPAQPARHRTTEARNGSQLMT